MLTFVAGQRPLTPLVTKPITAVSGFGLPPELEAARLAAIADRPPARTWFDDLADCESGEWTADGHVEGSARWDLPPGNHIFEGGLQFHPDTWDWLRPEGFPEAAQDATRMQQIVVGRLVLDAQGWQAWPVCSRRIGLPLSKDSDT